MWKKNVYNSVIPRHIDFDELYTFCGKKKNYKLSFDFFEISELNSKTGEHPLHIFDKN